ncbi:hypothetical protein C2G38_2139703 [Gigaspora rosea]|uniref:BTB domain-containing protein n=1 Tax=Gigaspora rosea TaxID=44941 RepID=A0A397VLZ7_9GLOM|nr:hypothetical protein C2G38_2139703 [Gigaspora rosea]
MKFFFIGAIESEAILSNAHEQMYSEALYESRLSASLFYQIINVKDEHENCLINMTGNRKSIKKTNISAKVFDIIIKYIYSGTISLENVESSVIFDLLTASNEFGLEELVKVTQQMLIDDKASWLRLNFTRVFKISLMDDNFKPLQQFCANIICKYPNIIFEAEEFTTITEDTLIYILKLNNLQIEEGKIWVHIIRWGIAQNPTLIPNTNPEQCILPPRNIQSEPLPLRNDIPELVELRKFGENYFNTKKYNEALECLTKLLEIEQDDEFALKYRGATYLMIDKCEEALIDLNKSLELKPHDTFALRNRDNAFALRSRGATYHDMDKLQDALSDLTKSLKTEPNNAFSLRCRGGVYRKLGKYNDALKDLTKSLEIDQNNSFALDNRGETYRMLSEYEKAIIDLTKSLRIRKHNAFALRSRGGAYLKIGRNEEALIDLTLSLNIEPNNAWALRNRGEIYRTCARNKEALADLTKSLEIEPNNVFAINSIKNIYTKHL